MSTIWLHAEEQLFEEVPDDTPMGYEEDEDIEDEDIEEPFDDDDDDEIDEDEE